MKQQLKKEYKRRLQLILSSKLHGRNKQDHGSHYMGGCCDAAGGLKWTAKELKTNKLER